MRDQTINWSEPILCEAKDGGFEQVSLTKGTCSCSSFFKVGSCVHLESARKWLGKHWDHYLAISALHKEIRRSDLDRAFAWAKILLRHQSDKSLLGYLERICFEETRNIPLYIKLRKKELSLYEALTTLITSRKKWEIDYLVKPSHFDRWVEGFRKSFSRPPPLPIELGQKMKSLKDVEEAYCLFFDLRRDKTLQSYFWESLEELANQRRHDRLKAYLKHASNTSYSRMVGAELLLDLYDPQARERHNVKTSSKLFIPYTRPYHFDQHHVRGRSILVENFGRAWEEKCFQFGDLDLRYSGSLFGVLFRERCYSQRGSMRRLDGCDWDWAQIEIDDRSYEDALSMENYYYRPTLQKVLNRHPHLKFNGLDLMSI